MKRKYYTLIVREDGAWSAHFGDFDHAVVSAERDEITGPHVSAHHVCPVKKSDTKILTTNDDQGSINIAIAAINNAI